MKNKLDSTQFTGDEIDVEAFRVRLRKMTDEELTREGKAGRYMCSPAANLGKPPRRCFVIQFEEVKAEWRRRHLKPPAAADVRSGGRSAVDRHRGESFATVLTES